MTEKRPGNAIIYSDKLKAYFTFDIIKLTARLIIIVPNLIAIASKTITILLSIQSCDLYSAFQCQTNRFTLKNFMHSVYMPEKLIHALPKLLN